MKPVMICLFQSRHDSASGMKSMDRPVSGSNPDSPFCHPYHPTISNEGIFMGFHENLATVSLSKRSISSFLLSPHQLPSILAVTIDTHSSTLSSKAVCT